MSKANSKPSLRYRRIGGLPPRLRHGRALLPAVLQPSDVRPQRGTNHRLQCPQVCQRETGREPDEK